MRRCIAMLLLITCAAPSSAVAQAGGGANPFGPLPQPQAPPPAPPQPQPANTSSSDDDGLGGTAFWLLIGATGVVFVAIGFYIVRDMRSAAGTSKKRRRRLRGTGRPAVDAAQALAEQPRHTPGSQKARAKAQQRAKTKAARKQRRKSRSR
jgi:hypothetical protein